MFRRSPFFYVGDKFKILDSVKKIFPLKINKFIEPFLGGGTVFLNVIANKYLLNDVNEYLIKLHKFLIENSKNETIFFNNISKLISRYKLSHSFLEDIVPIELKNKYIKTYYAQYNKEGYNMLKTDYNKNKNDMYKLYLLVIYGFNRMLRYNSSGEYNIPVGNVDFNKNVYCALIEYFRFVYNKNISLYNSSASTTARGGPTASRRRGASTPPRTTATTATASTGCSTTR